jgi:hypothetical protein
VRPDDELNPARPVPHGTTPHDETTDVSRESHEPPKHAARHLAGTDWAHDELAEDQRVAGRTQSEGIDPDDHIDE